MNRIALGLCVAATAAAIVACGLSTSTANPTAAATEAVAVPSDTAPAATAAPTSLDPCQVLTSQDASKLTGVAFGDGLEGTTPGGMKTCTYGAQTANVFTVMVGQATDLATAKAYKAQFEADLKAQAQQLSVAGLKVTELPNFADGAVIGSLNFSAGGITLSGSGIGFLKGTIFVGFSDVATGGQAPTTDALQAQAQTILGQLP